MASKTSQEPASLAAVEELLDTVDKTMERLKTLYEQYFLGIQKQAPTFIHNDIERKLRDLTQMNIRNTGLRYRLATLQQKFGSYNSYWRRTVRQIENGTYGRNLSKIGREAARTGAEIPEEILAAMPKRMRDQVIRDREQALAISRRRDQTQSDLAPPDGLPDADDAAAMINEPSQLKRELRGRDGSHMLSEDDGDLDFESFFKQMDDNTQPGVPSPFAQLDEPEPEPAPPPRPSQPAVRPVAAAVRPPLPRANTAPIAPASPASIVPPSASDALAGPTILTRGPRAQTLTDPDEMTQANVPIPMPPPRVPAPPLAASRQTGPVPAIPSPMAARPSAPNPTIPNIPGHASSGGAPLAKAPSQITRPNPIAPGSVQAREPVPVQSMQGPFPRAQSQGGTDAPTVPLTRVPTPPPAQRPSQPSVTRSPTPQPGQPGAPGPRPVTRSPTPQPGQRPPPGMTDADVNALYAKYVQAKQSVGEATGPGARDKLLQTINAQAPKIMEQYKAKGVDFTVVVKDNQVVIRAKPKG